MPNHEAQARVVSVQLRRLRDSGILAISITLGLIVVLLRQSLLPERFFYDSERIQAIALGAIDASEDRSYSAIGNFYRAIGVANSETAAGLVGYISFVVVILLVVWRASELEPANGAALFLVPISVVLGAVFLGSFSKDVFPTLIVGAAFVLPRKMIGEVLLLAAIVVYGATTRQYWLLVAVGYVLIRIVLSRKPTRRKLLGYSACILAGMGMAIFLYSGVSADYFRVRVNEGRYGVEDAASIISPFFTGAEPISGILNVLLTWPMLLVPIPLLVLSSLYHALVFVLLSLITITFCRKLGWTSWGLTSPASYLHRASALLVAFSLVQALFEPDYGSYLRHLVPLLPLAIYVVWAAPKAPENKSKFNTRELSLG